MMSFKPSAALAFVAVALAACAVEDTGKLCNNPNITFPNEPVTGEVPVVEVVGIARDTACETFQCIAHKGLAPYCSRQCTYNAAPANPTACQSDSECAAPKHCHQGVCNNDDCPPGFWCRNVQDVGPLASQLYCVRRDKCKQPSDCGAIGQVSCVVLGCYDVCLETQGTCAFHALTCEPKTTLGCECPGGVPTCADADLLCKPPTAPQSWPVGAVRQVGVCLPK